MSKRFTDTEKWTGRPWFRKLSPAGKLLWLYMLDTCDLAGVIQLDVDLAAFVIGTPITSETLAEMGKQVMEIDGGKLWVTDFVDFQYGELKEACRPHNAVIRCLKGYRKGSNTLFNLYSKGYKTKTRTKTKTSEEEVGVGEGTPEDIYDAYPRHVAKDVAVKAIAKALTKVSHQELQEAVAAYAKSQQGNDTKFIPHPATWFHQERWTDDRKEWEVWKGEEVQDELQLETGPPKDPEWDDVNKRWKS